MASAKEAVRHAGLDPEHRLLLAHAVVGMAEGASRHWLDARGEEPDGPGDTEDERDAEAKRLATRLADFAWAGLRQVHRI